MEVFLLGLVRNGSKRHLPLDHSHSSISQANLVAGIDDGSIADRRSVSQIPSRHIGSEPDCGVVAARGVAFERKGSAGGIMLTRGVALERLESACGVNVAGGVVTEGLVSAGGVEVANVV